MLSAQVPGLDCFVVPFRFEVRILIPFMRLGFAIASLLLA